MNEQKEHPMSVVSRRTGLSPHVVRMWERRYSVVMPERTASNRRLYSDSDIVRLNLLQQAVKTGHSIGRIAHLPNETLLEYIRADGNTPALEEQQDIPDKSSHDSGRENPYRSYIDNCLKAVEETRAGKLDTMLTSANISLGLINTLHHIISPLMRETGVLWQRGALRIYQEHTATAAVRTFLGNTLRSIQVPETAPAAVVTTPAGQVHEIGALICAVTAAYLGWNVTYAGPAVPAEEMAGIAAERNAKALILSIVYPPSDIFTRNELERLKELLPPSAGTICGGLAAGSYRDIIEKNGFYLLNDYRELMELLAELLP